ncbi:MAG TPA: hypothetical protein VFX96_04515 [Pyrinomonadaceae bacterium]|nr:hypothetical protein [Pyrinomonadaceae bacterium]
MALFLATMGVAGQYAKFVLGREKLLGFVQLFDLDKEITFPSLFQSSTLLLSSAMLAVIALVRKRAGRGDALQWGVLALIFLLMTLEEAARIHYHVIEPLRRRAGVGGWLYTTWAVPATAAALFFRRFLRDLPARVRVSYILAAALLWGGAVGVEIVNLAYAQEHGGQNMTYALLTAVEEFMEMAGVIVFIDGTLRYMSTEMPELTVAVE